jgi:transcriptional regulator with XRE-family HTH domain
MQETNHPAFLPHQNSLKAVSLIGHQVRVLRELRGLTRKAFSILLLPNVSRSYVYRIESGCIKPSLETLERIASALDLPLGAFFLDPESLETQVYSRYVQQITPFLKLIPDRSFETILSFVREMHGPALVRRHARRVPVTPPSLASIIQPSTALVSSF